MCLVRKGLRASGHARYHARIHALGTAGTTAAGQYPAQAGSHAIDAISHVIGSITPAAAATGSLVQRGQQTQPRASYPEGCLRGDVIPATGLAWFRDVIEPGAAKLGSLVRWLAGGFVTRRWGHTRLGHVAHDRDLAHSF